MDCPIGTGPRFRRGRSGSTNWSPLPPCSPWTVCCPKTRPSTETFSRMRCGGGASPTSRTACTARCAPRCAIAPCCMRGYSTWTCRCAIRPRAGHVRSRFAAAGCRHIQMVRTVRTIEDVAHDCRRIAMSRLEGVSDSDAGLGAKIAFFFTKRKLAKMTGLETAEMLEPLRMYAHIPRLLNAYGRLEQAESKLDILSPRHRALAELKSATTVRCEYCIDLGSQIARQWGITDEELLGMADYQNASCFSHLDKLILEYATAISRTPVEVSDELFDA